MLFATSLLAFATLRAMPGDPVEIALVAWNVAATPETIGALRRQWGLDQPLAGQYLSWLGRFVLGDWGVSFRTGRPILREMLERLPISAALGFGSLAIASLLAVPLGFLAALKPRGLADHLSRAINVLTQSVPAFWLGLVLLWFLGVKLQLLRPFSGEPATRLAAPILLLAFYSLGPLSRVYRTELLAASREPYFVTARAKGLGMARALWSHGHRAALFAMVAAMAPEFAWVVGGTAVTEVVFALPGVSLFLVQSIGARDYFVLQAYLVAIGVWMLLARTAIEAALRGLEPRLRR
ncbi:MAG: ABC transporter permease [Alphaproteobacteria bacterium]|nr:ABC transporter permease [Alphaproteobacteria bacterium]